MSAPAFTPGPWGVFDDEERFVVAVGQIGEDTICEPLGDTSEQAEANGHLIAAAPDLYEILSTLIETIEQVEPGYFSLMTCEGFNAELALGDARTILARARGEQ